MARGSGFAALVLLAMAMESGAAQSPAGETLQQEEAACQRGDMAACVRAGRAHETGTGTAENKEAAVSLYRRACDGKDGDGCARLGWLTFIGKGARRDFDAGYTLLEKGCDELESGEACYLLSAVNLSSEHSDLEDLGRTNLMASCALKYGEGCYELGLAFLEGEHGFEQDAAAAVFIWDDACTYGHARACADAAYAFEHNPEIRRDPDEAARLNRKACELDREFCQQPAAAAPATPAAPPTPVATLRIAGVQLGVDTVESVERDVKARGGSPSAGGTGAGAANFRLNALSGDFQDSGPDVMAVNYDFNAAGPAGRLIGVTIVRNRPVNTDAGAYASLVAERQAAIAKDVGPLQQKSPTEFTATASGIEAALHVNADTGYLYESYRLTDPSRLPAATPAAAAASGAGAAASAGPFAADDADLKRARAAGIDTVVLGMQLGDLVQLPACPQQSLFELGMAPKVSTTCIKTGDLVEDLLGMIEEINPQHTGNESIPWDFTAALPVSRCQDWIGSCEFSGRLVDGRLVAVLIPTTGLQSQQKVFDVLAGKYGRASTQSQRGYVNDTTGGQVLATEADWGLPGLRVTFRGYLGGAVGSGGYVLIETEAAAQRSGQVRRANEAQKQQL